MSAAGPLDGFRILDLTSFILGPMAAQYLGDMGADVIKIEAPEGDVTRSIGARRSEGMGALFLANNRNKRSVVLDLKRADGRAALAALAAPKTRYSISGSRNTSRPSSRRPRRRAARRCRSSSRTGSTPFSNAASPAFAGAEPIGSRVSAATLRQVCAREAGGVLVQAARSCGLNAARRAGRGAWQRRPRRLFNERALRPPAGAGASMGVVFADPAAHPVGRSSRVALAGAANRSSGHRDISHQAIRTESQRSRHRRGHAHPALWLGRQSAYPSTLPQVGREGSHPFPRLDGA